ncbi:MAG: RHS repeat-associated core domain-containing protein [Verrucomicrobiae bacterium]|nr:RHS repeat-associated core domain-containing protein [Verrucomicrobiae bacterium]
MKKLRKKVWNNTAGTGNPATYLKYLYDGWNLIAELNGNSGNALVRSYTWGLDASGSMQGAGGVGGLLMVNAGTNAVHFPAYDLNGNVMGLVNATNGIISAKYEYGPFGEVFCSVGDMAKVNPFQFSTKYTDNETDLLYYGYRYYSPALGRWMSRDPIEEKGGLNLYGFVNNDPVNKWDKLGLWNEDIHLFETLNWASQSGYPPTAAWNIGMANNGVDGGWSGGGLGWNPFIGDQSYHFNRSLSGGLDTRIKHHVEHLQNAKDLCTWPQEDSPVEAAEQLGISLHPLQDWFAHGDYGIQDIFGIYDIHNSHSPQTEFGSPGDYPDDPSLDAIGSTNGRPAGKALKRGYINEIGMPYPGAYVTIPVYREWAEYKKGNMRITLTQKETKVTLRDFRSHVKKHGGPCCRKYFDVTK